MHPDRWTLGLTSEQGRRRARPRRTGRRHRTTSGVGGSTHLARIELRAGRIGPPVANPDGREQRMACGDRAVQPAARPVRPPHPPDRHAPPGPRPPRPARGRPPRRYEATYARASAATARRSRTAGRPGPVQHVGGVPAPSDTACDGPRSARGRGCTSWTTAPQRAALWTLVLQAERLPGSARGGLRGPARRTGCGRRGGVADGAADLTRARQHGGGPGRPGPPSGSCSPPRPPGSPRRS